MIDESEYRPRLTALELAHEKLDGTLREQSEHAEHLDRKAAGALQASLAFSSVASATMYYLYRGGDPHRYGTLDTPFTYLALAFALVSLLLSIATIYHTNIEAAMAPSNVREGALYGRKELLLTFVEAYSEYIRRNDRRLEIDKLLLSGAQSCLTLAVFSTVIVVVLFVNQWTIYLPILMAGTVVAGFVAGSLATIVAITLLGPGLDSGGRGIDPKR